MIRHQTDKQISSGKCDQTDGRNAQGKHSPETADSPSELRDRYRPLWTILFALALILWATTISAQEPVAVTYAGETFIVPVNPVTTSLMPAESVSDDLGPSTSGSKKRPVTVRVQAALANFDADADPDGWIATLQLRDEFDRFVSRRAMARFELIPRVPTSDHRGYINADQKPVQWTIPVQFSKESATKVQLKLNRRIERAFDWPSGIQLASYIQSGRFSNRNGVLRTSEFVGNRSAVRARTVITSDLMSETIRREVSMPSWGVLNVRVAVAGEGVFAASSMTRLRPPVLVDTSWPYR